MVLAFCAASSQAQDSSCNGKGMYSLAECNRSKEFFEHLQSAVAANQREEVAGMVNFPLNTSLGGKRVKVCSRQVFLASYDRIFNVGVQCALKQASKDDVWGRDTGFTFKDGTVWWDAIIPPGASVSAASDFSLKFPLKIISVNNGQAPGPGCSATK